MTKRKYLQRSVITVGLAAYTLFVLISCVPKVIRPASKLTVRVNISPSANNNNPVAFDLVLVKNGKLFKELMKISAAEWFEKRKQYQLDYPKETGLSAGSWEWVPGQVVKIDPISSKEKFAGGLVFANYFNPGAHRAVIDPTKSFVVTLGPQDISVTPEK